MLSLHNRSLREYYLKKVSGEEAAEEPPAVYEGEKPADFITEDQLAALRVETSVFYFFLNFERFYHFRHSFADISSLIAYCSHSNRHINPKMREFIMDISAKDSLRQADGVLFKTNNDFQFFIFFHPKQ